MIALDQLKLQRLHRDKLKTLIFVDNECRIFAYRALEICKELLCMAQRFADIHSCFSSACR